MGLKIKTDAIKGFAPIADKNSRVLILGSMPSVVSLRKQQYYGHCRNAFWPVMMALLASAVDLDYELRKQVLLDRGLAVWDVLQSCSRPGSLDSDIEMATIKINDFETFFQQHTEIRAVFFNGAKAQTLFNKRVFPQLPERFRYLSYQRLPSTSPAHASLTIHQKKEQWRSILRYL